MLSSIITGTEITLSAFFICTAVSLILGIAVAALSMYKAKSKYSQSYILTLAMLPALVQIVIMMVNGNIGAGVAVAGAFGLIRFRSAPGTAKEICGVFMATAIGLACGMGYVGVAALFFLVMGTFVLLLSLLRMGEVSSSYRLLRITIPETLEYDGLFDDLFAKYTSRHELVKVKTTNMGTLYELSYDIYLKDGEVKKEFIDAIRCRNGNLNVSCGRQNDKEML